MDYAGKNRNNMYRKYYYYYAITHHARSLSRHSQVLQ